MLTALRGLGTKFISWAVGEGGRTWAKQVAVNTATKEVMRAGAKADEALAKADTYGIRGGGGNNMIEMVDKGHRKVGGFWGGVAISVAIGVGVSLLVPGAGFIVLGITQGIGTTVVEAGIGALTDDETPTPAPVQTEEPVEENLPPVSGTNPEPGDPGYEPQPAPTPYIYSNVTPEPHEEPPCDENDPHGGCYNPPHEEEPYEPPPHEED